MTNYQNMKNVLTAMENAGLAGTPEFQFVADKIAIMEEKERLRLARMEHRDFELTNAILSVLSCHYGLTSTEMTASTICELVKIDFIKETIEGGAMYTVSILHRINDAIHHPEYAVGSLVRVKNILDRLVEKGVVKKTANRTSHDKKPTFFYSLVNVEDEIVNNKNR